MCNLDRATPGYARGYRDCRDRRPNLFPNGSDGTFLGYDYSEGWAACWNEMYWDAVRENERRPRRSDTCECGRIFCAYPECER